MEFNFFYRYNYHKSHCHSKETHVCGECGMKFKSKRRLQNHSNQIHVYTTCDYCGKQCNKNQMKNLTRKWLNWVLKKSKFTSFSALQTWWTNPASQLWQKSGPDLAAYSIASTELSSSWCPPPIWEPESKLAMDQDSLK